MSRQILDGRYELGEPLGEGGMARVFRGMDVQLQRPVAIKLLPEDRAEDEHLRERLVREAQAMARLNHPHVVQVYGSAGPKSPTPYLVTELVDGTDLADALLENGAMPWELALWIVERCLSGLAAIHATAIIHRDIKPSNILITREGLPKIADLGVAKLADRTGITAVGSRPGTLAYLPPEAYEFAAPTPQLDIYAMGCVLYELIAGAPPYEAEGTTALVALIRKGQRQKLSNRINNLSPGVCEIIDRALAADPKQRPASAEAMRAECRALLEQAHATDLAAIARGWIEDPSERDWIDELREKAAKSPPPAEPPRPPALPAATTDSAVPAKDRRPLLAIGATLALAIGAGFALRPAPVAPPSPVASPSARATPEPADRTDAARQLMLAGSYDAAETMLLPAFVTKPDDVEALHLLASIRLASSRTEPAAEAIQKAHTLAPKDPEVLDLYVEVELVRHEYAHAEELARALVALAPKDVGHLTKLATVLCAGGKGGEAAAVVQRALALRPGLDQLKSLREILGQPCK